MSELTSLLSVLILGSASIGAATIPVDAPCSQTISSIETRVMPVHDRFTAPSVSGPHAESVKLLGTDQLVGRRVMQVNPSYNALLLSDRSALGFLLAYKDIRSVLGFRVSDRDTRVKSAVSFASPKCLDVWDNPRTSSDAGEIILTNYSDTFPRVVLRLKKHKHFAELFRVEQSKTNGRQTETISPLIITDQPIDAVGLGPPPFHGGARTLMLTTKRADGSLVLRWYGLNLP